MYSCLGWKYVYLWKVLWIFRTIWTYLLVIFPNIVKSGQIWQTFSWLPWLGSNSHKVYMKGHFLWIHSSFWPILFYTDMEYNKEKEYFIFCCTLLSERPQYEARPRQPVTGPFGPTLSTMTWSTPCQPVVSARSYLRKPGDNTGWPSVSRPLGSFLCDLQGLLLFPDVPSFLQRVLFISRVRHPLGLSPPGRERADDTQTPPPAWQRSATRHSDVMFTQRWCKFISGIAFQRRCQHGSDNVCSTM